MKRFLVIVSLWFLRIWLNINNIVNFIWFCKKGIIFFNYFGVIYLFELNYMVVIVGDYFGMQNDVFNCSLCNVLIVIDFLEYRGILWGFYQEDMFYFGFEGFFWVNYQNGVNDYVCKYNFVVFYDSIVIFEQCLF